MSAYGLVGGAALARACDCAAPVVEKELRRAAAVFSGRVVQIEPTGQRNEFDEPRVVVTLRVQRRWKGANGPQAVLRTVLNRVSCDGFWFEEDQEYLVYAYRGTDGALATTWCSGTKDVGKAAEEIEILERETRAEPPPDATHDEFMQISSEALQREYGYLAARCPSDQGAVELAQELTLTKLEQDRMLYRYLRAHHPERAGRSRTAVPFGEPFSLSAELTDEDVRGLTAAYPQYAAVAIRYQELLAHYQDIRADEAVKRCRSQAWGDAAYQKLLAEESKRYQRINAMLDAEAASASP